MTFPEERVTKRGIVISTRKIGGTTKPTVQHKQIDKLYQLIGAKDVIKVALDSPDLTVEDYWELQEAIDAKIAQFKP